MSLLQARLGIDAGGITFYRISYPPGGWYGFFQDQKLNKVNEPRKYCHHIVKN